MTTMSLHVIPPVRYNDDEVFKVSLKQYAQDKDKVWLTSYVRQSKYSKFKSCAAFSSPEAGLVLVSTKKSRPLARSNTGSPRFTDFPSLCACSESSLTNLIGSGFNLLCSQSHSKTECRWTRPEVVISWCWPLGTRMRALMIQLMSSCAHALEKDP